MLRIALLILAWSLFGWVWWKNTHPTPIYNHEPTAASNTHTSSQDTQKPKRQTPPINRYVEKASFEDNMKLAYHVANDVGVEPEIVQAILVKESGGGKAKNLVNRGAYGLMQIKIVAARSVLKRYPEIKSKYFGNFKKLSDYQISKVLLTNRKANIHIGCLHLITYNNIVGGDWDKTIVAYNMGIGNALKHDDVSNNEYLQIVHKHKATTVASFNNIHNL